jgi:hypothetical protein
MVIVSVAACAARQHEVPVRDTVHGTGFSGRELLIGFAVHKGVDYLCKTMPILCAHWGNAGESIAGSSL